MSYHQVDSWKYTHLSSGTNCGPTLIPHVKAVTLSALKQMICYIDMEKLENDPNVKVKSIRCHSKNFSHSSNNSLQGKMAIVIAPTSTLNTAKEDNCAVLNEDGDYLKWLLSFHVTVNIQEMARL